MNSPSKSSGHEHAGMAAGATTSGPHTHHHHASHAGSDDAGGSSSHSQPDAATRDPVCGMAVTAASEHRSTHLGNTYLFCSTGCKAIRHRSGAICQRWRGHRHRQRPCAASPCQHRSFTGPGGIANRTRNDLHLPMHPEIRQDHPGTCPRDDAGAPAARPRRRQPGVA